MFQSKTAMKVLSLLMATILWGYVIWETNPAISPTINNVPVQILNAESIEEKGLIILDPQDYTVNVKVQGKKKDAGNIKASDIRVTADLDGYGEGEAVLELNVTTSENISVVEVVPDKIVLNIDRIVESEKEVRVEPDGALPADAELSSMTPDAETVTVKGASTLVANVAYVSASIPTDSMIDGENTQTVQLVPVDSQGVQVDGVSVSPASIEVATVVYYTKTVPLITEVVGEPAEGKTADVIARENITVRGRRNTIRNLTEVRGIVDISGMAESGEVPVRLELADGVSLAHGEADVFASVIKKDENPQESGGDEGEQQAE